MKADDKVWMIESKTAKHSTDLNLAQILVSCDRWINTSLNTFIPSYKLDRNECSVYGY